MAFHSNDIDPDDYAPTFPYDRPKDLVLECTGCHKQPKDILEYDPRMTAEEDDVPGPDPDDYVWHNEGTLNKANGHFLCTADYIRAGQPSSRSGWVAP